MVWFQDRQPFGMRPAHVLALVRPRDIKCEVPHCASAFMPFLRCAIAEAIAQMASARLVEAEGRMKAGQNEPPRLVVLVPAGGP